MGIENPRILVIAGPNGAGKTTFDPDRAAVQAGRLMIEVIRRRYELGWENFQREYRDLVNDWELYDNSGRDPVLIERGTKT